MVQCHRAVFCCIALTLAFPAALRADDREVIARLAGEIEFGLSSSEHVGRYHLNPEGAHLAKPYFWPLYASYPTPITRAWPMEKAKPGETTDHVHQKSMWFCHGDVIPEGMELKDRVKGVEGVDFWAESKGHGWIVGMSADVDKEHHRVTTRNEWRTSDGRKILDETRVLRFQAKGDSRLFVFDIDLEASVCPITFGDTKEGAFGIRINDAIREQKGKGKLENAERKVGERTCWGQISAWCDYSGPLDGKTIGLAILDHPSNKYPACWHSRGYGLMAANPFGRGKSGFPAMAGRSDLVRLAKGEHLKLRYGLLIHPGDAKSGKVAEVFAEFAKMK